MNNPLIAFDESGNTGQDLLNQSQPVFTLASIYYDVDEAKEIVGFISKNKPGEMKFKRLKKSRSAQKKLLEFLNSERASHEKIKISVYNKSFLVTTYIVDLLIEPLAHCDGIDLYKQGANLALSNLYHIVFPVFCGKNNYKELQHRFVEMIRVKDYTSVKSFYDTAWNLYETCSYDKFKTSIAPLVASQKIINSLIINADITIIDPAIPAFVQHCDIWGKQFGNYFDLVHDNSKPLEHKSEMLTFLMAKDEKEVEVGYDRRKMTLPLKATGIKFCDSKLVPQVNIADIIAGSGVYWGRGLIGESVDQYFWQGLNDSKLPELVIGAIWPTKYVTPKELGTEEEGGIDAIEYIANMVRRGKGKKEKKK